MVQLCLLPIIHHCLFDMYVLGSNAYVHVQLPFLNRDPKAVEIVQVILESVLLRREKTMRDRDGNRIVELPAKEVGTLPRCWNLG